MVQIDTVDEGMFFASTVGLGLLGQPELRLCWPVALKDRADAVMNDLIVSCCEGEGASKLYDKRSSRETCPQGPPTWRP